MVQRGVLATRARKRSLTAMEEENVHEREVPGDSAVQAVAVASK
jgi:hypothetical protein